MRIVKKYSNRKLYDTQESHYVTLRDLVGYLRTNEEFQVVSKETGEDLTGVTLAQALVGEAEGKRIVFGLDGNMAALVGILRTSGAHTTG